MSEILNAGSAEVKRTKPKELRVLLKKANAPVALESAQTVLNAERKRMRSIYLVHGVENAITKQLTLDGQKQGQKKVYPLLAQDENLHAANAAALRKIQSKATVWHAIDKMIVSGDLKLSALKNIKRVYVRVVMSVLHIAIHIAQFALMLTQLDCASSLKKQRLNLNLGAKPIRFMRRRLTLDILQAQPFGLGC